MLPNRLLTLLLILFSFSLVAQPPGPPPHKPPTKQQREQMETMKIGFITKKLELTSTEAQQFWPIYNEYQKKLEQARKFWRQMETEQIDIDQTDDAQLKELMDKRLSSREQEVKIEKEYYAKFQEVLTTKKLAKLYKAEVDFKRELLHQLRGRPRGQKGPPPRPR